MKKKIISIIMSMVMLFGMAFSFTGCSFESQFESDGKFKYYYDESRDGYIIVGTELFGYSDPMYVPAYYKGKPIVDISYWKRGFIGGGGDAYNIDFGDVKKVYLPFTCAVKMGPYDIREFYIISNSFLILHSNITSFNEENEEKYSTKLKDLYLTSTRFYRFVQEIVNVDTRYVLEGNKKYDYEIYDYYFKVKPHYYNVSMATIKIANTSYLFNYNSAPNEGYFFINNFENGALIENTPYEPLREGYVFDGWYKEPECINKCNFGIDTYVEQYDENGELIFNELKLYAKWR